MLKNLLGLSATYVLLVLHYEQIANGNMIKMHASLPLEYHAMSSVDLCMAVVHLISAIAFDPVTLHTV